MMLPPVVPISDMLPNTELAGSGRGRGEEGRGGDGGREVGEKGMEGGRRDNKSTLQCIARVQVWKFLSC